MTEIVARLGVLVGLIVVLACWTGCQSPQEVTAVESGSQDMTDVPGVRPLQKQELAQQAATGSGMQVTTNPSDAHVAAVSTMTTQASAPVQAQPNRSLQRVSMFYPTGEAETSAIEVEKSVPNEVLISDPFEYEMKVTNLTDQTLHDVVVSDRLSEHLKMTASFPAGQPSEGGFVKWFLGTLGPDDSKTVRVTAVASGGGTVASFATVSYHTWLSAPISVLEPRVEITKSGPDQRLRCDEVTYQFDLTNTGTVVVNDLQINEQLPVGIETQDGKSAIQIDAGTLVPGQSRRFTVTLKALKAGRFSSHAIAIGKGGVSAVSNELMTWVHEPKLKITNAGSMKKILGKNVTHEIVVTNQGDGEARDTVLDGTVPAGAEFVGASDGGLLTDGVVRWRLGTIQPGDTKKAAITFNADQAGVFQTTAVVSAVCASRATASAQTRYVGIPAIVLDVMDLEDPAEVGQNETYVITASNRGSAAGTSVKITCTLEENVQYISSSGPTAGTESGETVEFAPLPSLAPDQEVSWRVIVKAVKPGDVRFKVSMTSDQLSRPVEQTEATNLISAMSAELVDEFWFR